VPMDEAQFRAAFAASSDLPQHRKPRSSLGVV
jgi:hypothetical protein